MTNSWNIGKAFGIKVYVHWTMLLLPLWILFTNTGPAALFALVLTAGLFGCVVLHELGHALAARHFRIRTRDITLYPIGGVARLESVGNRPWEEFWIALAGPAVNVAIALGLGAVWLAMISVNPVLAAETLLGHFVYWLMVVNVGMIVFNLLPAFPMDGGRVLRAVLAGAIGQVRATRIAAGIGMVLAVLIGVVGVVYLHNPWLAFIAAFVFLAGQQELHVVEMQHRVRAASWAPFGNADTFNWHTQAWSAPHVDPHAQPEANDAPRSKVTVYVWDPEAQIWVKQ